MIFYFSGTGNSEYAARRLSLKTGGEVVSIGESVKAGKNEFILTDDEALGFVFPVYAFDVPEIVLNFIKTMKLENYLNQYVFAVFTCGMNTGISHRRLKKALAENDVELRLACDLHMPDNYIVMFNPPEPDKQEKILAAAEHVIDEIAQTINDRVEGVVLRGKNPPNFASGLVSHFFNKYAVSTKKFYATDACMSCGQCERICHDLAITLEHGRPRWRKGNCVKCMGCINRCPARAIEHGGSTVKRARYAHPIYRDKIDKARRLAAKHLPIQDASL